MSAHRAIIHVDMDAFYAAVEQRDRPELQGRPVVVGGTGERGVVAAASYEARAFGVHSAMPSLRARALCPDAVFLRPRMDHYRAESARVFAILARFTPLVEPLSLDEAFLDVTACRQLLGTAGEIGRSLRAAIAGETGLVASVGIAPSKFVAKLASDHEKPRGFVEVAPDRVQEFLDPLPVRRMWGVGPKTARRLEGAGYATFAQLRSAPREDLARRVGRGAAERLVQLAAGLDDRPVVPHRPEKSLSREVTLSRDLERAEACHRIILELSGEVAHRLRERALRGSEVQVKIRTSDFRTRLRSERVEPPIDGDQHLYRRARRLFEQWWHEEGPRPVRLLGVGMSGLVPATQGELFAGEPRRVDRLRDSVRARFGEGALRPAALLRRDDDADR